MKAVPYSNRVGALAGLLVSMLVWPAVALSQVVNCSSAVPGGTYDDVFVTQSCTLTGVTVRGSVLVSDGASVALDGGSIVHGNVIANSGGDVTVNAATVSGLVSLISSGNLSIGAGALIGAVSLEKSGSIAMNGGSVAKIETNESAGVTLDGGAAVHGDVNVKFGGNVTVNIATVSGTVSLAGSGNLSVTRGEVGVVHVDKSGTVTVDGGSVTGIESFASEGVTVSGARVFPGGILLKGAQGALVICGSEIGLNSDLDPGDGLGSGGIAMLDSDGEVHVGRSESCDQTRFRGDLMVSKGTGAVRVVGAFTDNGDLTVIERVGAVDVEDASFGDILIAKAKSGNLTLRNVRTDSDVIIAENEGGVTLESSAIRGDAQFSSNASVTIRSSSFQLEDVIISKTSGPVVVDGNCDLSLTIIENGDVSITNNNVNDAASAGAACTSEFGLIDVDVSKNGNVYLANNTGELLKCSDNASVVPVGNSFSVTQGQCDGISVRPGIVHESALEHLDDDAPASFELAPSRPNPVRGRGVAEIAYSLPRASIVRLDIIDLQGRVIQALANGWRAPGAHRVTWDGRIRDGGFAGAGTYFYRLRAGNQTLSRTMVVMP